MTQAFSRQAPVWVRVAVSATVLALYYTSFPWAHALLGADFVDLGALPVAAVAACFGVAVGLLFVPVILVADAAILVVNGGAITEAANIAHAILLCSIAVGFGLMQQLLRSTRRQKDELEASLQKARGLLAFVAKHPGEGQAEAKRLLAKLNNVKDKEFDK